jgi:hypothetical protein
MWGLHNQQLNKQGFPYCSGVICASITEQRRQELELGMMVDNNTEKHCTAFTHTVDYNIGTRNVRKAIPPCFEHFLAFMHWKNWCLLTTRTHTAYPFAFRHYHGHFGGRPDVNG